MLGIEKDTAVYLACGSTDMRKSINGLMVMVQEAYRVVRHRPNHTCGFTGPQSMTHRLCFTTPAGASSSAMIYSIIETAKENKLKPYEYLKFVFDKLQLIDASNSTEYPYCTALH